MILGTDLSHWQTNDAASPKYFFEPAIAKEKGMHFAFLRASIGRNEDKAVDHIAKGCEEAGMPFGLYHFLSSNVDYKAQADKFIDVANRYNYNLPLVCDVEHDGVGLGVARLFCGRVVSKTGKKMIIYSSPSFWNGLIGVDKADWALEYDYWVANYLTALKFPIRGIPDIVTTNTKYPAKLKPWSLHDRDWTFWQFCAAGDGEYYGGDYAKHTDKVGLDMNVFNGTLDQFNAKYGLTNVPVPEPEPQIPDITWPQVKEWLAANLNNLELIDKE